MRLVRALLAVIAASFLGLCVDTATASAAPAPTTPTAPAAKCSSPSPATARHQSPTAGRRQPQPGSHHQARATSRPKASPSTRCPVLGSNAQRSGLAAIGVIIVGLAIAAIFSGKLKPRAMRLNRR